MTPKSALLGVFFGVNMVYLLCIYWVLIGRQTAPKTDDLINILKLSEAGVRDKLLIFKGFLIFLINTIFTPYRHKIIKKRGV